MRRLLVVALALAGCHRTTLRFACATDAQCGAAGMCVTGACAFPASDCPSGLRFDKSAIDLAGQCVVFGNDMGANPLCGPSGPPAANAQAVATCAIGAAPTIDGDLSDWPDSLFTNQISHALSRDPTNLSNWSNDEHANDLDISATFAVRWDLANLYVAVRIMDNIPGVHPPGTPNTYFVDDAVELFLDGDDDRSVMYNADDYQIVKTVDGRTALGEKGMGMFMFVVGAPPDSLLVAKPVPGTAANWNLEISIPWKDLGDQPAFHGRQIGFDLQLDDDDTPGGTTPIPKHQLLWKSQGPTTSCASCCQPFCNTQYFGTLELGGP